MCNRTAVTPRCTIQVHKKDNTPCNYVTGADYVPQCANLTCRLINIAINTHLGLPLINIHGMRHALMRGAIAMDRASSTTSMALSETAGRKTWGRHATANSAKKAVVKPWLVAGHLAIPAGIGEDMGLLRTMATTLLTTAVTLQYRLPLSASFINAQHQMSTDLPSVMLVKLQAQRRVRALTSALMPTYVGELKGINAETLDHMHRSGNCEIEQLYPNGTFCDVNEINATAIDPRCQVNSCKDGECTAVDSFKPAGTQCFGDGWNSITEIYGCHNEECCPRCDGAGKCIEVMDGQPCTNCTGGYCSEQPGGCEPNGCVCNSGECRNNVGVYWYGIYYQYDSGDAYYLD
eukprot:SM000099S25191  [mRNA]  locus=s99:62909:65991:+ [translate_table: standard]